MNKRHYEHTLPNIRGSLSNTYGTTGKMNVGWVDMNDTSKYFRFVINYTVE